MDPHFFDSNLANCVVQQALRRVAPLAVIKELNLDVKVVDIADAPEEFEKYFPLKKIPGFVTSDGVVLHEVIAITVYRKCRLQAFASLSF